MDSLLDNDLLFDRTNGNFIEYHASGSTLIGSVGQIVNVASPIPLNGKVLIACDFKPDGKGDYGHADGLFVETSLSSIPFYECDSKQIQYLHELQQIFRAKFKKEMPVDLNRLLNAL